MLRVSCVIALALSLFACGGPATVTGTVAGNSFTIQDAVVVSVSSSGSSNTGAVISMTSAANACQNIKDKIRPKGASGVVFVLVRLDANANPLPIIAGDYQVNSEPSGAGMWALGAVGKDDDACKSTIPEGQSNATSGKVTVTSVDFSTGGVTAGTFDLTIGSQADKISGSFSATFCESAASIPSGDSTCQ